VYNVQLTESLFAAEVDDDVREITIGDLLREVATDHPTALALVEIKPEGDTRRRWTYRDLLCDSKKLALALSTRFHPGERITIWAPNIPEWLLMEYACALAGIIVVTANPAYQSKELRYVLTQSDSVALFLIQSYRGNPMVQIGVQATQGLDAIREIVDLEHREMLYRVGDQATSLPKVAPGDAVMIQYTSGTTGFPKGAVLTHRGLVNNARFYAGRAQTHQNTVWANIMPMFHTAGCGMVSLGCLQAACTMLLVTLFDPMVVTRLIEQEKVSTILGVPTMLVALLEILERQSHNMSSVEMISSGGATVAPELVRNIKKFFDCKFGTLYGQTETSPVITQHHHDDSLEDICNTIGQPLPQTHVSIRSVDENHVVSLDTVGEICVRAYCNMIEYYDNPSATAETIDEEGWLHTGDLGTMDCRGYVRITGRVKEMIIRGGENLFPAEIENVLLEHPLITEVAVVGIPDDKWGEVIACFIRAEATQEINPKVLHHHCRQHLSPQKTPVIWCKVEAFPLTGSGKIQKFALRDGYLAGNYQFL
jgi:fatty-acyl-CoA synthase